MKQTEPHCRQILTEKLVQLCDIVEKNQGGLTMHMLKKEFMDRFNRFHFFFIFILGLADQFTNSITDRSRLQHHGPSILCPLDFNIGNESWDLALEMLRFVAYSWIYSWILRKMVSAKFELLYFLTWSSLIDFCSHSDKDYGTPCSWFYIALLEMQVGLRVKGPGLRLPDHNGPHDGPGLFAWPKRKYI